MSEDLRSLPTMAFFVGGVVLGKDSRLRQVAKNVPLIYWLAGLWRYLGFRHKRRLAERDYRPDKRLLPPPMLRYRVHGAFDEASYLQSGEAIAAAVVGVLRAHLGDIERIHLLDFACGPGRVLQSVAKQLPHCRLQGSDIDEEAIAWACLKIPHVAQFSVNSSEPPSGYADATFDAVYCISLFTHLDEGACNAWLRELSRILKPGGLLLVTTHGRFAVESCTSKERRVLERDGIVYRVDHKGRFKVDGLPDFYQTTFHTREYIASQWGEIVPLESHVEGGLVGHQDIVVLRKPAMVQVGEVAV